MVALDGRWRGFSLGRLADVVANLAQRLVGLRHYRCGDLEHMHLAGPHPQLDRYSGRAQPPRGQPSVVQQDGGQDVVGSDGMDALSNRGTVVQPDKRNPLAVAAAAAWLGVGFVMVVAVACWARGAPAWGGPSVGPQSVPRPSSRVYACLALS